MSNTQQAVKKYENLSKDQLFLLHKYLDNEMCLLKKICYPLIRKKNLAQMEDDELFDDAMITLLESVHSFDFNQTNCTFETFFIGNLQKSYIDWTRDRLRFKRCNLQTDRDGKILFGEDGMPITIKNVSFDAPSENDLSLIERLPSPEKQEFSENTCHYLDSLSDLELLVTNKIMEGYKISELSEVLHIPGKQVERILHNMRSFEKRCILKQNTNINKNKEESTMSSVTKEKSKSDKMSISSLKKKIENYTLRFDHPLQRESEQWTNPMKGNLIFDILQGNPLPALIFAEQVVNGIAVIWDLDGKQRCTNAVNYVNNAFRISKKVRRGIISYQTIEKDEDGKIVCDENGFPKTEQVEFDIRNRYFRDLPEELQDKILDYNFEITQYINCSSDDIAYHIARYNDGRPMNTQQKGLINLGEKYASIVKGITALPFFKEMGNYNVKTEYRNGTIDRVVVESIMTTNFLDDWIKDQSEMCSFLKENATMETFEDFEDMVDRLTHVANEDMLSQFNSKNSFLWFGLFGRFVNLGEDDKKFVEFMAEFSRSLHSKQINGESFDELCDKTSSTKDKNVVVSKITKLNDLMMDYLGVNISNKNIA